MHASQFANLYPFLADRNGLLRIASDKSKALVLQEKPRKQTVGGAKSKYAGS